MVVAAIAVVVNATVSVVLHYRRVNFEEELAKRKFDFDVTLAERKASLDYRSADYQRKQKLAGDILSAFYEVQRAMPAIRSPASWATEGQSRPRPEEAEFEDVAKTRNSYYVVLERHNKHREVFARFLSQQFTAMALLGIDAGKPFEDLNQLINRISGSASMLIRTADAAHPRPHPGWRQWQADIWEGNGDPADDRVHKELNRIAEAVDAICKPILSAKSPALSNVAN